MKTCFYYSLFMLIVSCGEGKKAPQTNDENSSSTDSAATAKSKKEDPVLRGWMNYYLNENPEFKTDKFIKTSSDAINYQSTSVKKLNEKGFNEMYKPFLIFDKSGTRYLDFDSYHWSLAPDGDISFEADQQVVLVDLPRRTAQQIAFFGPSFKIEEAYWPDDSTAVLLGNTYEKVPFQMKFNFKNNKMQYFQYPDTLKFKKSYYENRLQQKLILSR